LDAYRVFMVNDANIAMAPNSALLSDAKLPPI